jgi:hypothetical protein
VFFLTIADRCQFNDGFRFFSGRLVLGEDIEFLRCASEHWSASQYRLQWQAAANRLASHPMATSAFVTSVARGTGNFEWWLARRRGHTVTFTNQLAFLHRPRLRISPGRAHEYRHLPAYRCAPEARALSEWRLPYSAIRRYIRIAVTPNRVSGLKRRAHGGQAAGR